MDIKDALEILAGDMGTNLEDWGIE